MCYKLYKETEKFLEVEHEINRVFIIIKLNITIKNNVNIIKISTRY